MGKRCLSLTCLCLFLLYASGCTQFGYYMQSIHGQLDIWNREQPIQAVIDDPASPPVLRDKLALALRAREFASAELGLPQNQSYRRYADLGRPYVVWNVIATPEFSMQPLQWCFVMAGCVSYRGYFSKNDAEAFAAEVAGVSEGTRAADPVAAAAQKRDVYVGGVPAYSTLGWFADPVLNTIVKYPAAEVARIIFHELSHQVVYVKDDSVFNESFAVAVEREGIKRWLAQHGSGQDQQLFEKMQSYRADFVDLVQTYRRRLDALYKQRIAVDAMRASKQQIFDDMQRDYAKLKVSWGGFAGYDRWFAQNPNNALLASVSIYTQRVPAFEAMLREHNGDLPRFFEAVKTLSRLDKAARDSALRQYAGEPVTAAGAL